MGEMAEQLRKNFKMGDDERYKNSVIPDFVHRCTDIAYGTHSQQVLDVYLPKEKKDTYPVIVSVHGGGWVYGDKDLYQWYCMSLVQFGYAVINFSYRLAPETKFPAALEDTASVLDWAGAHAKEYSLDTDHVYMVGDSAGAHMTACYVNILTNPEYAKLFAFKPSAIRPLAVGLNCGVFSKDELFKEGLSSLFKVEACAEPFDPIDEVRGDVLSNITENFLPTYILTSSEDFLKPEAPKLASVLTEKNVENVMHVFCRKGIRLSHVFHTNETMPEAIEANREETQFFDAHR